MLMKKIGHRRMCEGDGSSGMFPQHLPSVTQAGLEGVIVCLRKVKQKISVCWMSAGERVSDGKRETLPGPLSVKCLVQVSSSLVFPSCFILNSGLILVLLSFPCLSDWIGHPNVFHLCLVVSLHLLYSCVSLC